MAAAGAAGVGATLGAGTPAAGATEAARAGPASGKAVPFYGAHQAGIATPTQEHVHFLALDVVSDSPADLRALLAALSAAAARLTAGQPVGALETGVDPPVDTGEALGLGPSRLTVTFGLGPSVFMAGRFGLEAQRPAPLVDLPPFASDSLQPGICDGDIAVQACAEDPQVAFHAVHDLIRLASPAAVPRWSLAGFGRTHNTAGQTTPRNIMGFKEGTANIVGQDQAALERFVWAGERESPAWMIGGSYMVVRRIQILLRNWDSISLEQQEQTFGRHKLSGAPLGEKHEHDPIDLQKARGRPASDLSARARPPRQSRVQPRPAAPAPRLFLQRRDLRRRRRGRTAVHLLPARSAPAIHPDAGSALAQRPAQRADRAHRKRDLRVPAGRRAGGVRRPAAVRLPVRY